METSLLLYATLAGGAIGTLLAAALRYTGTAAPADTLVASIDALLPQTQCGQCGHAGCLPYAEAIAGGAAINRCPPGGDRTVTALAALLHTPPLPLDIEGPAPAKTVAFIREAECIGCTKCIQACPVDAILGASKLMHTVIADECTGCDLCVEPCPVDCIEMRPLASAVAADAPPVVATPILAAVPAAVQHAAQPCIRCGLCADECPVALLPQQLYRFARADDAGQLQAHDLDACIECGACAAICPSHIPLVGYFQAAKTELKILRAEHDHAARYKTRFLAHNVRVLAGADERAQRRQQRRQIIASKTVEPEPAAAVDKQAEIRAAIARAKAKKAAAQTPPH